MKINDDLFMLDLFEKMIMLGIGNQQTLKILSDYDQVVEEFHEKTTVQLIAETMKYASEANLTMQDARNHLLFMINGGN